MARKKVVNDDGSVQMSFDLVETKDGYIAVLNAIDPTNMTLEEIEKANKVLDEIERNAFDPKEKNRDDDILEEQEEKPAEVKPEEKPEEEKPEEKPSFVWTEADENDYKADKDIPWWCK